MENTVQARAVRVAGECEAFPRSYFSVVCCDEGDIAAEAIEVICEHELTIVANGCELATLMCSNANLSELVCAKSSPSTWMRRDASRAFRSPIRCGVPLRL